MRGKKPNRYMKGGFRLRPDGSPVVNTRLTRARFLGTAAAGVAGAMVAGAGVAHATPHCPSIIYWPDPNYPTLQNAVDAVCGGGTVYVKYGTYDLGWDTIELNDPKKSVNIIGLSENGNKPRITTKGQSGVQVWNLNSGKTVTLDNLDIYATGIRGLHVRYTNGGTINVNDCILEGEWSGLLLDGSDNSTVITNANINLTNSYLIGNWGALNAFSYPGPVEGHVYAENNTFESKNYQFGAYSMGVYLSSDSTEFSAMFVRNKIVMTSPAPQYSWQFSVPIVCGSTHYPQLAVYNVTINDMEISCENKVNNILFVQGENCHFNNIRLANSINSDSGIEISGFGVPNTTNNCSFTGIDFRNLNAARAQVYMEAEVHNNEFKNNDYGSVDLSSAPAAFVIHGYDIRLVNENFWGVYPGLPDVPCLWLSEGTQGNSITALKNGQNLQGMDLCYQILNDGDNYISGYEKCQNVPQHVIDNMRRKECLALGGSWNGETCTLPPLPAFPIPEE